MMANILYSKYSIRWGILRGVKMGLLGDAQIKDAEVIEKSQRRRETEAIIKKNESRSFVTPLLYFLGWTVVIISVIYGVNLSSINNNLGIIYIFSGVVIGFLVIGFSVGLDLLQKIYMNTRK
jgi:hypothetical protein